MTVEEPKHYHVSIASSAVADIKNIRQYILDTFCYEAYAKDFRTKSQTPSENEPFPVGLFIRRQALFSKDMRFISAHGNLI